MVFRHAAVGGSLRRTMRRLAVVCLLASLPVLAQEKVAKDREATSFNEIERGLHLSVAAGLWATINPPAGPGSARYFLLGQSARVELGYDFGERFSLGIFAQATANRAGTDYTGKSQDEVSGAPRASGDYTEFIPGVTARISLAGLKDSQDVKRGWFYVRAGAGFVIYQPKALLPGSDVLIFAGPGLEYFTRLRHFSIGIEADFIFMALNASVGFTVTPMVRYAF